MFGEGRTGIPFEEGFSGIEGGVLRNIEALRKGGLPGEQAAWHFGTSPINLEWRLAQAFKYAAENRGEMLFVLHESVSPRTPVTWSGLWPFFEGKTPSKCPFRAVLGVNCEIAYSHGAP